MGGRGRLSVCLGESMSRGVPSRIGSSASYGREGAEGRPTGPFEDGRRSWRMVQRRNSGQTSRNPNERDKNGT